MSRIDSVLSSLQSGVQFFLQRTNQDGQAIQDGMTEFWDEVKPDIDELLSDAAGGKALAADSLELFADAAAARASRLILAFAEAEQAALGAVIIAGLKTAIALAIAAA